MPVWRRFPAAPLPPKTSTKYKRKTIFQSSKIAQIITRNSTSSLCLRLIGHYRIQSVLQKGFQIALQERFRPHCKKSSESQALNRLQKSNVETRHCCVCLSDRTCSLPCNEEHDNRRTHHA